MESPLQAGSFPHCRSSITFPFQRGLPAPQNNPSPARGMAAIFRICRQQITPALPLPTALFPRGVDKTPLDGRSDQWVHAFAGPAGGTAPRGAPFPPFRRCCCLDHHHHQAKQRYTLKKVRGWFPPFFFSPRHDRTAGWGKSGVINTRRRARSRQEHGVCASALKT